MRATISELRAKVDEVNDQSSRLLADNVQLSQSATAILESLNNRYKQLENLINQRLHALQNALRDFGPSSQHFLAGWWPISSNCRHFSVAICL